MTTASRIIKVRGREIVDSRGDPTVEADVVTECGALGRAAVPSGASTGSREAVELRDNDAARFNGKGVTCAVANINGEIAQVLLGLDACDQRTLDERLIALDASANKQRLGANALLAVSLASARAGAAARERTLYSHLDDVSGGHRFRCLPVPLINILNGGCHASNSTDIQEFMVVPVGAASIREAVRAGSEIFQALKAVLGEKGCVTTVGDEGGFAPSLDSNETAIEIVLEAVGRAGYTPGDDVWLALDSASTEIYRAGHYHFDSESRSYDAGGLIACYEDWVGKYPILSIEDGLSEGDWDGWREMTARLGSKVQLVGDDLFVTNAELIRKGVELDVANSVLIKFNQIGTLSETFDAIDAATEAGYSCIISHRSGETEDATIADLAVATGVGQIKTGSLSRTDRVAKYNQLMRIEEELGDECAYAGRDAFKNFLG